MAEMARPRSKRSFDLKRQKGFGFTAYACLGLLYAPLAVLIFYSFNAQRSISQWAGFSTQWYEKVFTNAPLSEALVNSVIIAAVATVASTVIATMAALATTRQRAWRGQTSTYLVINAPLMVPEIVTAIASLGFFFTFFGDFLGIQLGIYSIMIAHTVFCIPFAYMPIRARLEDMDQTLEQAAADLYATPWQAFRRITLPLMMPGVTAGAALAFVVSFDDFTITSFLVGPGDTTLPIFILTSIRRGISPELNAMSSLILLMSIVLVSASFLIGRRKK